MVTRNYDLKTVQDYIDYLDELGFTEKWYDYLDGSIERIDCCNKTINKNVSLDISMDEDYREELLRNPSEEVEADFNRFKVTAIAIDSHITTEANYFDDSIEHIYLVDKNQEVKTSFLMRLTYPFFILIVLLMIIFSPIYYICTGKWAYEYKQKPFSWIWEWGKKLEFF